VESTASSHAIQTASCQVDVVLYMVVTRVMDSARKCTIRIATLLDVQVVIHIAMLQHHPAPLRAHVPVPVCLVTYSAPSLNRVQHVQLAVQTVQVLEHALMALVAAIRSILVEAAKGAIHNAYLAV
jgi:hypothetical protein